MYFLYSILFCVGVVLLLPRFLFDALRHGKYAAGLRERAGVLPDFDSGGRPVVWLHCVSVGETQAARPLARAILEEYPGHALVVSTTTLTSTSLTAVSTRTSVQIGPAINGRPARSRPPDRSGA